MKSNAEDITIITPEPDSFRAYLRKVWRYRALILIFARRDLTVKYTQTLLGAGWSILQPLMALLIFTFFFGYLLNWETGDIPYPVYVLSGLLGWNFFTYIVNAGSTSIQEASHTIKKIYFPKSVLPLSKVIGASAELLFSFLLLIPLLIWYDLGISWRIVFLPFVLIFNALCGLALVFWIASFAYRLRDLFHLLPFIIYIGIWVTPVFFSNTILPENVRFLINFNPMASVVNLWRWMLFEHTPFQLVWIYHSLCILLVCIAGMYYYNRRESAFTDFV